jgi:acyl carrier protein
VPYVNRGSDRLTMMFVGWHPVPAGFHQLALQHSGLMEDNLLLFRHGKELYESGVTADVAGLERLAAYARDQVEQHFAHVRHIVPLSMSAGAPHAMYCGHALEAAEVWAMSPRVVPADVADEVWSEREAFWKRYFGPDVDLNPWGMVSREQAGTALELIESPDLAVWRQRNVVGVERLTDMPLLEELVRRVAASQQTRFHLCYERHNPVDAFVAEAFRGCPSAEVHAYEVDATALAARRDAAPWVLRAQVIEPTHFFFTGLFRDGGMGRLLRGDVEALALPGVKAKAPTRAIARDAVRDQIVESICREADIDRGELSDDTSLLADGMVDSFVLLAVLKDISDRWGVAVDASKLTLEDLETVASLTSFVLAAIDSAR